MVRLYILWPLIIVCTFCLCPIKGTLGGARGLYGITRQVINQCFNAFEFVVLYSFCTAISFHLGYIRVAHACQVQSLPSQAPE